MVGCVPANGGVGACQWWGVCLLMVGWVPANGGMGLVRWVPANGRVGAC